MWSFLDWLLTQLILGDFKWTLLGAGLMAAALLFYLVIYAIMKGRYPVLRIILGIAFVILFVYFGHELFDPYFHMLETWFVTPQAEPMHLFGG